MPATFQSAVRWGSGSATTLEISSTGSSGMSHKLALRSTARSQVVAQTTAAPASSHSRTIRPWARLTTTPCSTGPRPRGSGRMYG